MCKCEIGLASIVEDTDTISSIDGRVGGRRTEWNQYISFLPAVDVGYNNGFCKYTAVTWHVLGIASMFFFLKILYWDFQFSYIFNPFEMYSWPMYCDIKMARNKQYHL